MPLLCLLSFTAVNSSWRYIQTRCPDTYRLDFPRKGGTARTRTPLTGHHAARHPRQSEPPRLAPAAPRRSPRGGHTCSTAAPKGKMKLSKSFRSKSEGGRGRARARWSRTSGSGIWRTGWRRRSARGTRWRKTSRPCACRTESSPGATFWRTGLATWNRAFAEASQDRDGERESERLRGELRRLGREKAKTEEDLGKGRTGTRVGEELHYLVRSGTIIAERLGAPAGRAAAETSEARAPSRL